MSKEYKASELAAEVNGTLKGNPDAVVRGVNSLKLAETGDISFLHNAKYLTAMRESKAEVIVVPGDWSKEPEGGRTYILCEDPDKAFTKICGLFAPDPIRYEMSVSPLAYVHPTAQVAEGVHVGPTAVIDEGAVVEKGAVISAGAYVGHFCRIGEGTFLAPNVTIMKRCEVGKRCIIHAGASIGADGFGFTPTFRGLVKIPQNGIVVIDDDVEIGANSTIDRARFGKTWIKKGVKIDNLVHVAHNVVVGESSVLIGQSGVAGSAELGRGVIVGAQAGINGHITLGDGSQVAGASAAQRSVAPGCSIFGTPGESQEDFIERHLLPRKVRKLEARLAKLEALLAEQSKKNE